jgi:hypothetical protein
MSFNPKVFSLFREFEMNLIADEIDAFTKFLNKKVNLLIRIRTISVILLILGFILFIIYGYILPYYYYDILGLTGWADLIVLTLIYSMMGIPVLMAFVFNNLFIRIRYFYWMTLEMYNSLHAENYFIQFNPWGQIARKLKYHQGGFIVAKEKSFWITGQIIYKKSESTYYDLLAKRNKSSIRHYAYLSYSLTKINNQGKLSLEIENQPEKILNKSISSQEIEIENQFAHLSKKERIAKIKEGIAARLYSIIEKT